MRRCGEKKGREKNIPDAIAIPSFKDKGKTSAGIKSFVKLTRREVIGRNTLLYTSCSPKHSCTQRAITNLSEAFFSNDNCR